MLLTSKTQASALFLLTLEISADISMNGQKSGAQQKSGWIWRCNTNSFEGKFKRYKSLVTSILLYGCET